MPRRLVVTISISISISILSSFAVLSTSSTNTKITNDVHETDKRIGSNVDDGRLRLDVVLGSFHAYGHIQPLLPLGHELALRGHHVRIAVPDPAVRSIEKALRDRGASEGIEVVGTGPDPALEDVRWRSPATLSYTMYDSLLDMFDEDNGTRPDIVVADFLSWSVSDAADSLKIPCVEVFENFGFDSVATSPFGFADALPVQYSGFRDDMPWWNGVANRILSMAQSVGRLSALVHMNIGRYERSLPLLPGLPGFNHRWIPRPTIRTTTWGIEFATLSSPLVEMVGPMTWRSVMRKRRRDDDERDVDDDEEDEENDSLREWLDESLKRNASVVYVSFGTNLDGDVSMMRHLYRIICPPDVDEKMKNNNNKSVRFLWSLKHSLRTRIIDDIDDDDDDDEKDPTSQARCERDGTLRMEHWVPQQSVLAHEAVQVFVSHGGANSVHEALAEAVPVVAIPSGLDQFDVGARLEVSGAGIRIRTFRKSPLAIANEILTTSRRVLTDDDGVGTALKRRASFLRGMFLNAGGASRAANFIEEIARYGWTHRVPKRWHCCCYYSGIDDDVQSDCSTIDVVLCVFDAGDLPVTLVMILIAWCMWTYPTESLGIALSVWFCVLVMYGGSEEYVVGTMWPVWRGSASAWID